MKELLEMKAGDFAITRGEWEAKIHQVLRVSKKCFWAAGRWSSREHRYDRSNVIFVGPDEVARLLLEQLQSSRAQLAKDKDDAAARYSQRNAAFIAAAITKATGATS